VSELIGPLGLPGAVVAIMATVFLTLKVKNEFLNGKRTGKAPNGYGLREASGLASDIRERVDVAERAIQDNINVSRHAYGNGIEKAIERLVREMELQTKEIVAAIREGRS
jgi:hypothetical protein